MVYEAGENLGYGGLLAWFGEDGKYWEDCRGVIERVWMLVVEI